MKVHARGSILPLALALLSACSLIAISAAQTAGLEFGLSKSLSDADQAFALAQHAADLALHRAGLNPDDLPASSDAAPLRMISPEQKPTGTLQYEVAFVSTDSFCPETAPVSGDRLNLAVLSKGTSGSATSNQLQGFYICRSSCSGQPCISAEFGPTRSYWTTLPTEP